MSTSIITFVEKQEPDGSWKPVDNVCVLDSQSYAFFGWLADIRNYCAVPVFEKSRSGIPEDASEYVTNQHNHSDFGPWGHVYARDLLSFDYNQMMEDRRVSGVIKGIIHGNITADPGDGEMKSYAVLFGEYVMADILKFCAMGPDNLRLIFAFNS